MRSRFVACLVICGVVAAGCGASIPSSAKAAPVLRVETGLYPIAQAAAMIGGSKADVVDLVPNGSDPYELAPKAGLAGAGLVVLSAPGLQPGLDAATKGLPSGRVVWMAGATAAADPYFWLDPTAMGKAVDTLAVAMEQADPGAAPVFKENVAGMQAEVSSLQNDFSSSLSVCPDKTFFTADGAFAAMAAEFGMTDHPVGAAPTGTVSTAVVRAAGVNTVFSEPWADDSGVDAIAQSGLKERTLDTLAGAPASGWPAHSTYFSLMEQNLGVLSPTLGCPSDNEQ